MAIYKKLCDGGFQSTLPHGSDIDIVPGKAKAFDFNPRSLTGATFVGSDSVKVFWHFNPRSLTGATNPPGRDYQHCQISIHAPSRERHDGVFGYQERYAISIHAPSRERPEYKTIYVKCTLFQSTLPHGSDQVTPGQAQMPLDISIHAPSRERRKTIK